MNIEMETIRNIAVNLYKGMSKKGFQVTSIHPYTDKYGVPIYYKARLEHEIDTKKVLPFHKNKQGIFIRGEPPELKGKLKPLYGLSLLYQYVDATVIVVEGEKCADVLNQFLSENNMHKYIAITSGGVNSVQNADWEPLRGRKVESWPDNDDLGKRCAEAVAKKLSSIDCDVSIIDILGLNLEPKGDCSDWLETARSIKDFEAIPRLNISEDDESNNAGRASADALVAFALTYIDLIHDHNKEVYAIRKDTNEVLIIHGRNFKEYLTANFYNETKKTIRDAVMREVLLTLSSLGRQSGERHPVYRRTAKFDDCYYLDLCQTGNSLAVKISAGAWEVIKVPPVHFIRSETMEALPIPTQDGDFNKVYDICNIRGDSDLLILAWLSEALRIDTPYPILEIIGEQGSAKSTTQKILRRVIDPNTCDLRGAPKSTEDLYVAAGSNYIVSCENISHLSPQMQDALCIISTGGSYAKRRLYSDGEEYVIQVSNPVMINGISVTITNQDLIDRAITLELSRVSERIVVSEIWSQFEANHAEILGGLLTLFSKALLVLPQVDLKASESPRLIEFARLGMALAMSSDRSGSDFMDQFNRYRQEAIARTIDSSPVATHLIEWFENQFSNSIEITTKDLYNTLTERRLPHDPWPKSARGLGDALRRVSPALLQIGIDCTSVGRRGSYIYWRLARKEKV
jgi:hypothetical protein